MLGGCRVPQQVAFLPHMLASQHWLCLSWTSDELLPAVSVTTAVQVVLPSGLIPFSASPLHPPLPAPPISLPFKSMERGARNLWKAAAQGSLLLVGLSPAMKPGYWSHPAHQPPFWSWP